jgi:hypothetical protein
MACTADALSFSHAEAYDHAQRHTDRLDLSSACDLPPNDVIRQYKLLCLLQSPTSVMKRRPSLEQMRRLTPVVSLNENRTTKVFSSRAARKCYRTLNRIDPET